MTSVSKRLSVFQVGVRKHRIPPTYGLLTDNFYNLANITNVNYESLEIIDRIADKCDHVHDTTEYECNRLLYMSSFLPAPIFFIGARRPL